MAQSLVLRRERRIDYTVMAESPMFRREWVVQIKEMLSNGDENSQANNDAILRVATPLLKMKPEAYIPQFLSIGPYHHSKLEKDIESSCAERKISTAEAYKGKAAATLSQKLEDRGKSFNSIVEMMERMLPEIQRFYHWPTIREGQYSNNFALMMALDSSFLLHFLCGCRSLLFSLPLSPMLNYDMMQLGPLHVCIKCDIMKLENQIPLSVLRGVFDLIFDGVQLDFSRVLEQTCIALYPFWPCNSLSIDEDEPHLLGCMHATISPFLQMKDGLSKRSVLQKLNGIPLNLVIKFFDLFPTTPFSKKSIARKFPNGFNAGQLARAGIKFEAFCELPNNIWFDKCSASLYLPRICISDISTEILLRNMVALEFNDTKRPKSVTRYVGLMDCLIQSPDDVRLLKDSGVISIRGIIPTLTDECIADMWNGICQPFFTSNLESYGEISEPLIQVLENTYYWSKITRTLLGLFYYVRFLAPLAGFLGLVMIAIRHTDRHTDL